MKKMIRMALMTAAMFMAVTTVAQAQGGGGGRGGARRDPIVILKDSLKVTDAAVLAKADSIVKAAATESAPLSEAARGGDADARTKLMAVTTKRNDAIKALLTDAQKADFDRLMSAGRRGGGF